MTRLSRRQFVAKAGAVGGSAAGLGLLGGCGISAIRAPWASPGPGRLPRIGVLDGDRSDDPGAFARSRLFREALGNLGYSEGDNVLLEWRFAEGRREELPALAADLVRLPVDLIVAASPPSIQAARSATSAIPIVMIFGENPVALGFVDSLARPGGNVTGLAAFSTELVAKRVQLLKETAPWISRVAVLYDASPAHPAMLSELERTAPTLGVVIRAFGARDPTDFEHAFSVAIADGVDSLLALQGIATGAYMHQIVQFAAQNRLPAIYFFRVWVQAGGLMSYSQSTAETYRRAASYVDRILKGARPADLPVEQPMRFDFMVNMRTARELGITFPHEVMLQVTEVIDG